MQYISRLRTMRAIERTARQYGYAGDTTLDEHDIPPLGTLGEQLAMVAIGLDSGVRLGSLHARDRAWVRDRLRSAVLGAPRHETTPQPPTQPARRRAW